MVPDAHQSHQASLSTHHEITDNHHEITDNHHEITKTFTREAPARRWRRERLLAHARPRLRHPRAARRALCTAQLNNLLMLVMLMENNTMRNKKVQQAS